MRSDEIGIPLFEMTFSRKIAEHKFRGREETLSEHLVKLLAFEAPETTRNAWKKEVRNHLIYLSRIKLPNKQPVPQRDAYDWLYGDPFTGNETSYVEAFIMMHADDFQRNERSIEDIAAWIKIFFTTAAEALSKGDPTTAITLLNTI